MTTKCHGKFEEKLTCDLENDTNLANFHQGIQKSQNLDLMGSFYLK